MQKSTDTPAGGHLSEVSRRQILGACIRAARQPMTQKAFGELMELPQTTISRWEKGLVNLTLEQVSMIERALDLMPGSLAMSSGYVDAPVNDPVAEAGIIKTTWYFSADDVADALDAAAELDLGAFVRSVKLPCDEGDPDVRQLAWEVSILPSVPGDPE